MLAAPPAKGSRRTTEAGPQKNLARIVRFLNIRREVAHVSRTITHSDIASPPRSQWTYRSLGRPDRARWNVFARRQLEAPRRPRDGGLFDAIGVGQWFRYLTGLIEVGSALALLVPSIAVFGALALVATMVGAIATHLFIVGGSPAVPAILLLGSASVVWARRHQLLGVQPIVR